MHMNELEIASIEFTIPGVPIAKGRPKFSRRGGFVTAYTPAKTLKAEKAIADEFKKLWNKKDLPENKAVILILDFKMPIPKSLSKKKRQALSTQWHCKKPDIDNLCKLVQDALNGLAWEDDSAVCIIQAKKSYSFEPCTVVRIEYIEKDLTNW